MDLHRCGDCRRDFDSFENFLIHKLLDEKYKVTIQPSERIPGLRLPKFVKTQNQIPLFVGEPQNRPVYIEKLSKPTVGDSQVPLITADADIEEVESTDVSDSVTSRAPETSVHHKLVSTASDTVILPSTRVECHSVAAGEGNEESDDNVSVLSQSESLRIDESATAKENVPSPIHSESQSDFDSKQKFTEYCKDCHRYYKNKVSLRVHQETVHSSERPYECCIGSCQHSYKTKGSLVRHMRTHTGERRFLCNECGRAFLHSGNLNRHVERLHHTPMKPLNEVQVLITRLIEDNQP